MQKDGAAVSFKLAAAPSFPFCLGDAALSLIVTGHAALAEVDDIGVVVLPVDHQGVIVLIHRGGFKEKDRRAFVELQRRGDFAAVLRDQIIALRKTQPESPANPHPKRKPPKHF